MVERKRCMNFGPEENAGAFFTEKRSGGLGIGADAEFHQGRANDGSTAGEADFAMNVGGLSLFQALPDKSDSLLDLVGRRRGEVRNGQIEVGKSAKGTGLGEFRSHVQHPSHAACPQVARLLGRGLSPQQQVGEHLVVTRGFSPVVDQGEPLPQACRRKKKPMQRPDASVGLSVNGRAPPESSTGYQSRGQRGPGHHPSPPAERPSAE